MLDVHPPEHAAHSWPDFFIHIATIVVGLLIAVGLEQTIEYIHHSRQAVETRDRVRAELVSDRETIAINLGRLQNDQNQLRIDSSILLQPHPTKASLAGLKYSWLLIMESTTAWDTAGQTGGLSLVRPEEAQEYSYIYRLFGEIHRTGEIYIEDVDTAKAIANRVNREGTISDLDRQHLLELTDRLSGNVTNQSDLYEFIDRSLKNWLDSH
jgi:hypothetical protein